MMVIMSLTDESDEGDDGHDHVHRPWRGRPRQPILPQPAKSLWDQS
jgi:hypothetical protein